ncbi:NUDIX domain-containing protein [Actinoallomurus rhizosphaericola]|uniref:NUDIX domain-containing protein n=1 Tax=Actinoallomurus rhizosphaericola TaxID=2952536 RepID=UPI002093387A|nr:NUDIX hydrolase [Actinoallomurus rhizosphaericola]MCO5997381.1 NUDIX hydrolase [Actinoallomurus rhizosphaericola]
MTGDVSGADPTGGNDGVADEPCRWETLGSEPRFKGAILEVRTDRVRMPNGDDSEVVERDIVVHPGSVGVICLDDEDRVLLLRQYRHAVGYRLWEPPAGLRDVEGEPLWRTAERELAEEAGYRAREWHTLLDACTSPGMTNERTRIFLARGLSEIPEGENDFERVHEEADMPTVWVPLEEAVTAVRRGRVHNSLAVMGILSVYAARATGFRDLRAPDAPEW